MARKKRQTVGFDQTIKEAATREAAEELTAMFDEYTVEQFGFLNPPDAYVTKTGIRTLDAILGGGFVSSGPVCFTSTPETGKSTIAYQFCKTFLDEYPNAVVIYADVESAGGTVENKSTFQSSRPETFGLSDDNRFRYNKRPFNVKEFFEYLTGLIEKKRLIEQQKEREIKFLIVLDSIAALPTSKLDAAEEFDKLPAARAKELTFYLNKLKQNFAYDRITMIAIDQLRADFKMKSKFEKDDEKTVGEFSGYKPASGVTTFQHMILQWLMFSKKKEISPAIGWGVDGWIVEVFTEKNKFVPSKYNLSVVFDKRAGIDKFWSEMMFITDYSPSEQKLIRDGQAPFMDLCIKTEGAYSKLVITNPETGEIEYQSPKGFYKKEAKDLYETSPEFKKWFDRAVDLSCEYRISRGLLRCKFEHEDIDETPEALFIPEPVTKEDEDLFSAALTEDNNTNEDGIQKKRGRKPKKQDDKVLHDIDIPDGEVIETPDVKDNLSVILG